MEETKRKPRIRSKPKQKPIHQLNFNPDFEGKTRTLCKVCYEKGIINYMDKSTKQFRPIENPDKTKRVCTHMYCDICRTVIWYEAGLKRIPK